MCSSLPSLLRRTQMASVQRVCIVPTPHQSSPISTQKLSILLGCIRLSSKVPLLYGISPSTRFFFPFASGFVYCPSLPNLVGCMRARIDMVGRFCFCFPLFKHFNPSSRYSRLLSGATSLSRFLRLLISAELGVSGIPRQTWLQATLFPFTVPLSRASAATAYFWRIVELV